MTNRNAEAPQVEVGNDAAAVPPASQAPPQNQNQGQPQAQPSAQGSNDNNNPFSRANNKVYKSGPLFLSSKGIGWTSWKKRWFVLTRTSLVFYRSDPNAVPQKGSEVNLTLGGIDLNSSGSVVVKEDKKLLTVLFPDGRDGRDGRAFTLKAETSEDLHEWKAALEEALASAPNPALVMGQNGILRNDQSNPADASAEQAKDRQPVKSLVVGGPILLALEELDGTPSFLEKSLKFVEDYGIAVEGILRQAADVEDVERRIREYEQGKKEFTPDEDAHVIADCVKYILRELPSSPVPATCCKALLEAYRTDRSNRVNAMRVAICETFPEPNRILLQRILVMMQSVAAHKNETRMSVSAVAACMAPLLLRPLLAGDCELEQGFDIAGDNSLQLMQAAAAANHAQAICITLIEEYNNLFGGGSASPEPYTDDEDDSESEELTDDDDDDEDEDDDDDDDDDEDEEEDDEDDYSTEGSEADVEEDNDQLSSTIGSDIDETEENKVSESSNSVSNCPEIEEIYDEPIVKLSPRPPISSSRELSNQSDDADKVDILYSVSGPLPSGFAETPVIAKSSVTSNGPGHRGHRTSPWGRNHGRKNLSMESIDLSLDDESEIEKLEAAKADLQNKIANEAKGNADLQSSLEERKKALHEQRLALERDVRRLQEQLQKEKDLRAALEAGLKCPGQGATSSTIGEKMKAEIEEIAQAESEVNSLKQIADDLGQQLHQQCEQNSKLQFDMSNQPSSNAKSKRERTSSQHVRQKSSRNKQEKNSEKLDRDKAIQQNDSSSEKPEKAKSCERPEKPKSSERPEKSKSSERPEKPKSSEKQEKGKRQESTDDNSEEQAVVKPASNSKKSSSRSEGINATTSALSKLTNRLNFLKERRTQMESQTTTDKSSGQSSQNPEKGQSDNKGSSNSQQQSDRGRKNDNHPELDRGKSESFPPGEKGRYTPRTNSR